MDHWRCKICKRCNDLARIHFSVGKMSAIYFNGLKSMWHELIFIRNPLKLWIIFDADRHFVRWLYNSLLRPNDKQSLDKRYILLLFFLQIKFPNAHEMCISIELSVFVVSALNYITSNSQIRSTAMFWIPMCRK